MKLLTGKRIGQSPGEFAAAAFFSLLFHLILLFGGIFLAFRSTPRVFVPPSYRVSLVNVPADVPLAPGPEQAPPAPKAPPVKAPAPRAPKAKQAPRVVAKLPPAPKAAMPELGDQKKKKEEQPAPETAAPASQPGKRQEAVAVAAAGGAQDFPFAPYVVIVRDKVERNWNPPPGAKGTSVKITFRILRSGRVGEASLQASSGNFYFDQAAMRAILSSSPFPPLPEGFFRDYETFSVDLMERE